jgi:GNAT superfamily N-acetyltransferase
MRAFVSALAASVLGMLPALAQDAPQAAPDSVACPAAVAEIATCYSAKQDSGAYVLAAMPKNWNGTLIVFAHGGPSMAPPTAKSSQGDLAKYAVEVKRGFAFVASSYRREGYGVEMAAADTDAARAFFVTRIAKPKHTLVHGASYGGLVTAKLLETYAKAPDGTAQYDGAFLNSGLVIGAPIGYQFRADLRAVYQYYCKNLPRPAEAQYPLWMGLPAQSTLTAKDLAARIDDCAGVAKPAAERSAGQKRNLSNIIGVMGFSDRVLVRNMQAATFLFRDIQLRITQGKSAFSNIGVRYKGSDDDAALNAGVVRFASDPRAVAALAADGQPTGALLIPMVSIHSINDPQVAVEVQAAYRARVDGAGNGARLVQAYTDEAQHTGQSAPEIAAALDGLMQWIEKGVAPTPESIAQSCKALQAALDGPCRYHPDFTPKPYDTRFYARALAAN